MFFSKKKLIEFIVHAIPTSAQNPDDIAVLMAGTAKCAQEKECLEGLAILTAAIFRGVESKLSREEFKEWVSEVLRRGKVLEVLGEAGEERGEPQGGSGEA